MPLNFFSMSQIRLTTIQSSLVWEDKTANLVAFQQKMAGLAGQTDIVILPEMFSTGFSMKSEALAEEMDGSTMQWLERQAKEIDAVVTGSFIARENGNYFNRLVWMLPDGHYETYDKKHLFTLAGEQNHYQPGTKRLIVEYKGWKICPLICYDLRFPVWSRNTEDFDLLIYVANWPQPRNHHWKNLLLARAIENQCFVVGVNRVGKDGNDLPYTGDTSIIDYSGNVLLQVSDVEQVATLQLSKEGLLEYRRRLLFLEDRDAFQFSK